MSHLRALLPALLALALADAPAAQTPATSVGKPLQIPIREHKLRNGLRVILSEDHRAPTYSICVTYNVGSRDERKGRTGFAHLFEHMMFQGSESVGKGEHFILVLVNGGGMNGTTNTDRTNYFQTLPANQLDLGLFLEADRMRSLAITAANFENQRNVVQEERRLGIDNQPYGKTFEAIGETAYDNFAYKHSVIGSMDDLNAATLDDVAQFFKTYYAPNNAVLAVVGDFNSGAALAKIRKYFESIPSKPQPPVPDMTEPEQMQERRKALDDAFARQPRLDIAFKIPWGNTPDYYALMITSSVLGQGQSSRLYQKLVKENEIATSVGTFAAERRGPGLFQVFAMLQPGKTFGDAEKLIAVEIDRLASEPVADWELQKARMTLRRQRAQQFQSTLFRAIVLSQLAVFYNDPALINAIEDRINRVTKADIQRVVRTYLKPARATVITTSPKGAATAARDTAPRSRTSLGRGSDDKWRAGP